MIFKRKLYSEMLLWKHHNEGASALLINSSRVNRRYLIYTKDLRKDGNITYLPAYMTQFL